MSGTLKFIPFPGSLHPFIWKTNYYDNIHCLGYKYTILYIFYYNARAMYDRWVAYVTV